MDERESLLEFLPCGHPKSDETSADGYTFCSVCAVNGPKPSLNPFLDLRRAVAALAVEVPDEVWADVNVKAEAALAEIDRLMRVYTAAADLVDDPFGSLDLRKFYALREAFYPTRDE